MLTQELQELTEMNLGRGCPYSHFENILRTVIIVCTIDEPSMCVEERERPRTYKHDMSILSKKVKQPKAKLDKRGGGG